jgi:hypothetical protein
MSQQLRDPARVEVHIVTALTATDRYTAAVVWDGLPTSFDCGHLYHRPDLARRCCRRLAAAWQRRVDRGDGPALIATNTCTPNVADGTSSYEVWAWRWQGNRAGTTWVAWFSTRPDARVVA